MKRYLLDTNGLLRFILNDITSQSDQITALFDGAKDGKNEVTIPHIVFFEATYVLSAYYAFSRLEIKTQWDALLSITYLEIPDRVIVQKACVLWTTHKGISFADAILVLMAKENGMKLITFDKKLARL